MESPHQAKEYPQLFLSVWTVLLTICHLVSAEAIQECNINEQLEKIYERTLDGKASAL
jgi:hypothetical protein